ncbi:MAG: hypothetical protein K0S12_1996 [Bacteroidetes bacterium]|jgi:hypothetical protein|nr:hypothetical protein [Bacteroidota bacterium]
MQIPANVKTLELSSSILWLDEDRILHSVPKPGVVPPQSSTEEIKQEMDKLRAFIGPDKVCMLLESNPNSQPPKREMREFIASEIESVTKAMAIITTSPVSKMIANLFFGLRPSSYPVKMFTDEKEARKWILQYR